MANASAKKTAAQNEASIKKLNIGVAVANCNYFLFRFLFNKPPFTKGQIALYLVTVIPSLLLYRWLVASGTPQRDETGQLITPGEDLSQPGLIEWAFDIIYVTWACHVGSALLGSWVWYLYLVIPGYALFKVFGFISPMLKSAIPSAAATANGDDAAGAPPAESKRQAKLRKRSERGDQRIKQVKRSVPS